MEDFSFGSLSAFVIVGKVGNRKLATKTPQNSGASPLFSVEVLANQRRDAKKQVRSPMEMGLGVACDFREGSSSTNQNQQVSPASGPGLTLNLLSGPPMRSKSDLRCFPLPLGSSIG